MELSDGAPRRLRRAEAVLQARMSRLAVVVEDLHDSHNIDAVIRTAEAFGLQNLYRVESSAQENIARGVTQGAHQWLTVQRYTDPASCVEALHEHGYTVWAADVGEGARPLHDMELPPRLAVAVGSELLGLSQELRDQVDDRFYLPMVGFTGSLNVSVTAAIVIWELARRMEERDGERGDLTDEDKAALREGWYHRLARTDAQKALFPGFIDDPPEPWSTHAPPPERQTLEASKKKT
jgi:tRNA (guanosine-2'-O-)-methyltransferase